jgi:iron(III) transport system ATP-binding protein
VLLMDEPLSNLDAKLRVQMRTVIKKLQRRLGITTIYVTNDQEEALAISDRIAVMKDGNIMQIGTPNEIYAKPQNPFVAGFIGVSNFMDCDIRGGENGVADVSIQGELSIQVPVSRAFTGKGKISARPEQLFFSKDGMPGKILFSTFLGDFIEYEVELDDGQNLIVNEYTKDTTEVHTDGERVFLSFDPTRISLYQADTEEVLSL